MRYFVNKLHLSEPLATSNLPNFMAIIIIMAINCMICSWLVLRSQYLDPSYTCKDGSENSSECQSKATASTDWCEDADNWGRYLPIIVYMMHLGVP